MGNEWSKKVFATNLKYYMRVSGKTQKELAEVAGVSAPTLNEWINEKKYPRIDKIQRLADYFGILKSDLIEDKKEKPIDADDGLSENMRKLIDFAKTVPEDKAALILQVMKSIVEAD